MSTYYRPNTPDIVFETIDGELVVLNLKQGDYFSFNRTGAQIFNYFEGGGDFNALQKYFGELFMKLSAEQVYSELHTFVQKLCTVGLLVPVELADCDQQAALLKADQRDAQLAEEEFVPPAFEQHTNLQDLLLLDPVHEVTAEGWPKQR